MRLDLRSRPDVALERSLRAQPARYALSGNVARIQTSREVQEPASQRAELALEPSRVELGNGTDRAEPKLLEPSRRFRARSPEIAHGLRREPRGGVRRRDDHEPIGLAVAARDFRDVLGARDADGHREAARRVANRALELRANLLGRAEQAFAARHVEERLVEA